MGPAGVPGGDAGPAKLHRLSGYSLALGLHFIRVVDHQLFRDRAWLECPLRDLGHRRDLRRGAGDEALGEAGQLIRHDAPFDHFDAAPLREINHGATCDAIQEAVRRRRVNFALTDDEDIGAGSLSHPVLPVEHDRVGLALTLGNVLGDRADHVEPSGL